MRTLSPAAQTSKSSPAVRGHRVIVGVDDDPASLEALRFGAEEAALRGSEVLAMHIWCSSNTVGKRGLRPDGGPTDGYGPDRLAEAVGTVLRERELQNKPPVRISIEVLEGVAEVELTMAATGAAMLVLGQRHHHRLFGSVSQQSLRGAQCVVVIVPPSVSAP